MVTSLNSAGTLESCLKSIMDLDYPRELVDVLVVDAGSNDSTVAMAHRFNAQVIVQPGVNRGDARNLSLRHAKGDLVATVDADNLLPRNWLRIAVGYMTDEEIVGLVDWQITPDRPMSFFQRIAFLNARRYQFKLPCWDSANALWRELSTRNSGDESVPTIASAL
jgi:glycosyltransferase involved in cell wall biosynthesis